MRQLGTLPHIISDPLREEEILVIRGGQGPSDPVIPSKEKKDSCETDSKAEKCDKCDKCDKCGLICF